MIPELTGSPIKPGDCLEIIYSGEKPIRIHILPTSLPEKEPKTTKFTPITPDKPLALVLLSQKTSQGEGRIYTSNPRGAETRTFTFQRIECEEIE